MFYHDPSIVTLPAGEISALHLTRVHTLNGTSISSSVFAELRGVGTAGATGTLAPAMWKPRGREYLIAPAIFSHIFACCSLNFHSLSLCCLHIIKTSHSVGTTGRILRNKFTKHTSPARISINKNSANARAYSHKMFVPATLKSFRRLSRS